MIYLASPYSSIRKFKLKDRYDAVEEAVALMIKEDMMVYSPIIHHHHLAIKYNLPKEFDFWQERDFYFIEFCKIFLILQLEGWKYSTGVEKEYKYAVERGKPIRYITTKELKDPHFSPYMLREEP